MERHVFCAAYASTGELEWLLLSYLAAGVACGELCLCVRPNISADDARSMLESQLLNRARTGQIEIIEHCPWLSRAGVFSGEEAIADLHARSERALAEGYSGLRVAVDLGDVAGPHRVGQLRGQAHFRKAFAGESILLLKTFGLANLSAGEALDILATHDGAFVFGSNGWHVTGEPVAESLNESLAAHGHALEQVRAQLAYEAHLGQGVLNALPAPIYTTDASGSITFCNEAGRRFARREIRIGEDKWSIGYRHHYTDMRVMACEDCPTADVLRTGQAVQGAEFVIERPDGSFVPVAAYPTPLRNTAGVLIGVVTMLVDVSERKIADDLQHNLVYELNHRVKNALATVQALASQTIRNEGIALEVRKTFEGRLLALSRTHGHLSRAGWGTTDLHAVLTDILSPFSRDSTTPARFEGDDVRLPPQYILTMGLVLHELASNASRFGALSVPEGRIVISWDQRSDENGTVLHLHWQEEGGPVVHAPAQRGFGCRFIEHSISHLEGRASLCFNAEGLGCDIEIPVKRGAGEAEWLNTAHLGLAEGRHGPAH